MRCAMACRSSLGRLACCLAVLLGTVVPALAALPTSQEEKTKVVGQPTSVEVQPSSITLIGPRSMQQLVVTGRYADGTVRDLTPFVNILADDPSLVSVSGEQ